jgi:hypothetical protein
VVLPLLSGPRWMALSGCSEAPSPSSWLGFWASALTATAVPGLGPSLPELFGLLAQRLHLRLREFLLDLSHFLQVLGAREPLGKVE